MRDLPNNEIQNLLNQIALGDDKAMTVLYKHYQRGLYAFVHLQVSNHSVAEEIVQDCFLAVNKSPLSFNGTCKYSTWLFAIGKFKAIDWLRKNRHENMQDLDEEINEIVDEIVDENKNILHALLQKECKKVLIACNDRLSISHKEVIQLAFVGNSLLEITEITGIPMGTVKSRLHYAMEQVKKCVKRSYGQDA